MYVMQIDRPKQFLSDHHPKGTTVVLELEYGEMILLKHAMAHYRNDGKLTDKEDLFFYWQFCSLRELCKNGNITSWIAEHYNMIQEQKKKEAKNER